MANKIPRLRFNISVTKRTEITANPNEISMGIKLYTHVEEPVLTNGRDLADAAIQLFGKRLYNKGRRLKPKVN